MIKHGHHIASCSYGQPRGGCFLLALHTCPSFRQWRAWHHRPGGLKPVSRVLNLVALNGYQITWKLILSPLAPDQMHINSPVTVKKLSNAELSKPMATRSSTGAVSCCTPSGDDIIMTVFPVHTWPAIWRPSCHHFWWFWWCRACHWRPDGPVCIPCYSWHSPDGSAMPPTLFKASNISWEDCGEQS